MSYTTLNINATKAVPDDIVAKASYKTGLTPNLGIFFSSTFPRFSKKLALNYGVNYSSIKMKDEFTWRNVYGSQSTYFKSDITYSRISFPLNIQYSFNTRNIQPYISGGVAVETLFVKKTAAHKEVTIGSGDPVVTEYEPFSLRSYQFLVQMRMGMYIMKNKFKIELLMEKGDSILREEFDGKEIHQSNTNAYALNIGYVF